MFMQIQQILSTLTRVKNLRGAILAGLALFSFVLACSFNERISPKEWSLPIEYGVDGPASDVKALFASVKAASEGNYIPFLPKRVPQLGAPYVANWDDYPCTEQFHILIAGLLAKAIGVFAAVNLLAILSHVLAVLGFYITCRAMNCRWEWSCLGGLLFGFASYLFARSEHHLTVAYVAHIPLVILVFRWAIAGDEPADPGAPGEEAVSAPSRLLDNPHFYWALGIAVFTGLNHVYYTNMLVQFLGLACLYHAWKKRWRCASRAATVAFTGVATFVLININSLWAGHVHGPNPAAVSRVFQWMEYSGFRLADMFIAPPSYWLPAFARWGERFFDQVVLKGEVPYGSYIGIAGVAAFLWLAAESVRGMVRTPFKRPPWEAFLIGWVVLYATVGGLNCWAGSLGLLLFRSSTRFTIYILALVLIFAVRRLSAISANWNSRLRLAVAGVLLIAVWDQVPRTMNEDQESIALAVKSDRTFTRQMEARLHPNSMVFQLPIMNFPECPAVGVAPYDHFRPFLYSKALRYSFGDVKGRRQSTWQGELGLLEPAALMARLESLGFGAVYINLGGYTDRGKAYLDAATDRGSPFIHSPAGDLACIYLKPSASPVLPPPGPFFGAGWNEMESDGEGRQQRVCRGSGELVLTNTTASPVERSLSCVLAGFDSRSVRIASGGRVIVETPVKSGRGMPIHKKIVLRPGENVFTFTTDRPPIPTMRGSLGFVMVNFQIAEAR